MVTFLYLLFIHPFLHPPSLLLSSFYLPSSSVMLFHLSSFFIHPTSSILLVHEFQLSTHRRQWYRCIQHDWHTSSKNSDEGFCEGFLFISRKLIFTSYTCQAWIIDVVILARRLLMLTNKLQQNSALILRTSVPFRKALLAISYTVVALSRHRLLLLYTS